MGGINDESGPTTDPNFWMIRNSLMPATRDMERAADLLSAASDMILKDRDEEAIALIQQADITDLFDLREQACRAPPVFSVHRLRKVANLLPKIPKGQRDPQFASESPLGETVFRRDGWRCRYCGCRVIPSKVRRWMDKRLPGTIRWGRANLECHAGFWTLWGSVDHVIPHSLGGRNKVENLVTACMTCNFARENYTLEQLGLTDPRSRPPVLDGWDGLTRLFAKAATRTPLVSAGPRTPPPRSGRRPPGETVLVGTRNKPAARPSLLSDAEYYAQLEARCPGLAQPLQVFLAGLADVGVVVEFIRSLVLRFSIGAGWKVSAGSILTDGRVFCADAYYYAQKHGHRDLGECYLSAVADLVDGEVRAAGRATPEVFGSGGQQINISVLLPNAELWKSAVTSFVLGMRAAMRK